MSQITKKAIIDCTIELARKKPINKIKIMDIVNEIGITRNTFYYHFHDVYDVLDCVITEKVESIGDNPSLKDVYEFIEFCAGYRPIWRNLYKAMGPDGLNHYVTKKMHGVIYKYIEAGCQGQQISEEDKNIISVFYEEALSGVLMRWIRGEFGSPEELEKKLNRIEILFDGSIKTIVENAKNN